MKALLATIMVVVLATSGAFAQQSGHNSTRDIKKTILREIRRALSHPGFPQGKGKSEAVVALRVTQCGRIEIDQMSATHQELIPVVERCLGNIRVDQGSTGEGELLYYRLRFRSSG